MKKSTLILLSLILCTSGCISMKVNGTKFTSDKSDIYAQSNPPKGRYVLSNNISLEEINIDDIKGLIPVDKKTLVVLWAPWCPHSLADFNYMNAGHKTDYDSVMVLCSNYDMLQIKTFSKNNTKNWLFYLIADPAANHKENLKIKDIQTMLFPTCKGTRGVPQQYYFVNGKLVWSNEGELSARK